MKGVLKQVTKALIIASLLVGSGVGFTGCKKKKELAAAQAAEEARKAEQIKEATAILEAIIADDNIENVEANYKKLDEVKAMNIEDPTVLNLIIKAQEKLAADKEALAAKREQERIEAEKKRAEAAAAAKIENDRKLLNQHFAALTGESDYEKANTIIENTMGMFANEDVPVLVIIAEENGQKDYDKPSTIKNYLNYLKDKKAYKAEVENVVYNDAGKITELELRKK